MNFTKIDIKNVEQYWDDRPCNIRHSNKPVATKEYFDEIELRKYFVEPHIKQFANFESWKNKNVLDGGCGIGTMTMNFAKVAKQVTAVDLSNKSLSMAKKRAEKFNLTNIKFIHANCETLQQSLDSTSKFDLIFSFGVVHHTPHPEKALRSFYNLLTPGGTLKCMVYYKYSWKVFWILLKYGKGQFWHLKKLVAKYSEAQTGCPITYIYSKKEIRRILEDIGFKVIENQPEHIFPYKIKPYVNYEYKKVWYFNWMPDRLFKWLEKKIGWHLCVTAVKM